MLKTLTKDDTTLTPYVAAKNWELSNTANTDLVLAENGNTIAVESIQYTFTFAIPVFNCSVALEKQSLDLARFREGLKVTGLFYPDSDPLNADKTYKRLVHAQLSTMFYNHYRDPTRIWGTERIDFDSSQTKKFLSDLVKLLDIPTDIFGDKMLEGSVKIIDNTLDNPTVISDDTHNNLFAGPNLFSKQQELGNHRNVFRTGSNSDCSVYFDFSAPSAPSNLIVTSGSAILTWNDNSTNEVGFNIERSLDGITYTSYATASMNAVTYTDHNVTTGSTYYYRLYAFNYFGSSSYSNTASITFTAVSPINYPNMEGWWKADSFSLPDGTSVGGTGNHWLDQSGNSNDLAQLDALPVFRTNQFGSLPAVNFTPPSDLVTSNLISFPGDFTIIVVLKQALNNKAVIWAGQDNSGFFKNFAGLNELLAFTGPNGTNIQLITPSLSSAQTALVMITWRRSGGTLSFRENKSALSGGGTYTSPTTNASVLGRRGGSGNEFSGSICETIIYSSNRTDSEMDALYDGYFKPKWGLP